MTLPLKTSASGFSLPSLGLGTWGMGGHREHDPDNDDDADINGIRRALDAGVTHIDTAELYASGHTETLIGRAVKDRPRESYTVASKVFMTNLAYDDVLRSCEASLERLGLDHLDLYYIHMRNPEIPLSETARALRTLQTRGLIRHIGVSNFLPASMKELQDNLDTPLAVNQSHYNLIYREPERSGLLPHCRSVGALLLAWRPIQWVSPVRPDQPPGNPWQRGVYPMLDEVADRHGKTNTQVALNWLIAQDNVCALFKTNKPSHLKDCLGAAGWALSPEDIERLRRDFPHQKDRSDAVPLA